MLEEKFKCIPRRLLTVFDWSAYRLLSENTDIGILHISYSMGFEACPSTQIPFIFPHLNDSEQYGPDFILNFKFLLCAGASLYIILQTFFLPALPSMEDELIAGTLFKASSLILCEDV